MPEDKIISALIGLVRACDNNPATANSAGVVLRALAFPAGGGSVEEMVQAIHAEKFAVSPGCAVCASPCGNTADYDMGLIHQAPVGIRSLKLAILSALHEAAGLLRPETLSPEDRETILKALSYISFDLNETVLQAVYKEVRALKPI